MKRLIALFLTRRICTALSYYRSCRREEERMQIGLLEDNPSIVEWLSTALEMAGNGVHPYQDGPSLLVCIFATDCIPTSLPFDLLIVDLLLPGGMSGLDVINCVRKAIP